MRLARRILPLLAALVILFPSSAAASMSQPSTPSPATTDSATSCASLGGVNQFNFMQSVGSSDRTAIKGRIIVGDGSTGFQQCLGTDIVNGPSAWIAIEGPNGNGIVQIGVIDCASPASLVDDVCDNHRGVRSMFYAFGGCNGYNPNPKYIGSAPEALALIDFDILEGSLHDRFYLHYDTSAGPYTTAVTIPYSDPAISCWAKGTKVAVAAAERWDPGDGWGSYANPIKFQFVQVRYNGGTTWYNFGSTACYDSGAPDGRCLVGSDYLTVWDV